MSVGVGRWRIPPRVDDHISLFFVILSDFDIPLDLTGMPSLLPLFPWFGTMKGGSFPCPFSLSCLSVQIIPFFIYSYYFSFHHAHMISSFQPQCYLQLSDIIITITRCTITFIFLHRIIVCRHMWTFGRQLALHDQRSTTHHMIIDNHDFSSFCAR